MAEQRALKCLIAAGGTAGHVLPSLAVAEALVARGVGVTFAGSPDRAEARLVPEAGFELDTFRVAGLPRRPGPAQVRALGKAMRAPRACRRILRERQPDVVLGGGGYVAGPMVYAASRMGIPAALMEADAQFGLALVAHGIQSHQRSSDPQRQPRTGGRINKRAPHHVAWNCKRDPPYRYDECARERPQHATGKANPNSARVTHPVAQ